MRKISKSIIVCLFLLSISITLNSCNGGWCTPATENSFSNYKFSNGDLLTASSSVMTVEQGAESSIYFVLTGSSTPFAIQLSTTTNSTQLNDTSNSLPNGSFYPQVLQILSSNSESSSIYSVSVSKNLPVGTYFIKLYASPVANTALQANTYLGYIQVNVVSTVAKKYIATSFNNITRLTSIYSSNDALTWQLESMVNVIVGAGIYANNKYVLIGSFVGTTDGAVLTSTDGRNWQSIMTNNLAALISITYGNGQFVVGGNQGIIQTSSDGYNWTTQSYNVYYRMYGLTYGGNHLYVGVGPNDTITSVNGATWVQKDNISKTLIGIVYAQNKYVSVGSSGLGTAGLVMSSPDGTNWLSPITVTESTFHSITYGNNTFVAVGNGGATISSQDGVKWSINSSGTNNRLMSVVYANGKFTAIGDAGTIINSDDGISWTVESQITSDNITNITVGY